MNGARDTRAARVTQLFILNLIDRCMLMCQSVIFNELCLRAAAFLSVIFAVNYLGKKNTAIVYVMPSFCPLFSMAFVHRARQLLEYSVPIFCVNWWFPIKSGNLTSEQYCECLRSQNSWCKYGGPHVWRVAANWALEPASVVVRTATPHSPCTALWIIISIIVYFLHLLL